MKTTRKQRDAAGDTLPLFSNLRDLPPMPERPRPRSLREIFLLGWQHFLPEAPTPVARRWKQG